jgi:DNA-binding GntR family transcriptional regulator
MQPADRFVPQYFRLESHLREGIRSGALKPGDPIPPNRTCLRSSASAGRPSARRCRASYMKA